MTKRKLLGLASVGLLAALALGCDESEVAGIGDASVVWSGPSYTVNGAAAVISFVENFDTDPGWTRFNNPANSNDFGFRGSNLAGGTAGEAGGFFSITDVPVWYGDETVGDFGGNDALSASGILNILSVDVDYNNNVFIGHFDNGGFSNAVQNGIGLQVLEHGENSFRIFYLAGIEEAEMFLIEGLELSRAWSYNYDPSAGSFGSLTVSISGPGGGTATHFLTSEERGSIGSIETFGFAVKPHSFPVSTAQAEIYFDNLTYDKEDVLQSLLDDILTSPDLDEGLAASLARQIENVVAKLDKGNVNAAINQLRAFISQVEALIRAGMLSQADGDLLIDMAERAIDQLNG